MNRFILDLLSILENLQRISLSITDRRDCKNTDTEKENTEYPALLITQIQKIEYLQNGTKLLI